MQFPCLGWLSFTITTFNFQLLPFCCWPHCSTSPSSLPLPSPSQSINTKNHRAVVGSAVLLFHQLIGVVKHASILPPGHWGCRRTWNTLTETELMTHTHDMVNYDSKMKHTFSQTRMIVEYGNWRTPKHIYKTHLVKSNACQKVSNDAHGEPQKHLVKHNQWYRNTNPPNVTFNGSVSSSS